MHNNMNLLRFLSAVQTHNETSKTLMAAAGYDVLELQIAAAMADDAGFVEATGQIHPSLRLTAAGLAWATQELAPFAHLIATTAMRGDA